MHVDGYTSRSKSVATVVDRPIGATLASTGAMRGLSELGLAVVVVLAAACSSEPQQSNTATSRETGRFRSTGPEPDSPNPIDPKWFSDTNKLRPDIRINYQPIGSGGGIRQLTSLDRVLRRHLTCQMNDEQIKALPRASPARPDGVRRGRPGLQPRGRPLVNSPDLHWRTSISVESRSGTTRRLRSSTRASPCRHRTLPSFTGPRVPGTTFIFADYLAKVSPEFQKTVGVNSAVNWPAGIGGKGNEGVSGLVSQTPGAIGYVELIYALQNKSSSLRQRSQNAAGEFVKASPDSVTKAAAGATIPVTISGRRSRTRRRGRVPDVLVHLAPALQDFGRQSSGARHQRLREVGTGRRPTIRDGAGYAPLPPNVAAKALAALDTVGTS